MGGILDWLESLPVGALYASLALVAAIENIFPPVPADTVVAFGSFLAARGHGTALGAFLATWVGNVDVTVIAEVPRIGPHREPMRRTLAAALGCDPASVSIKGKTNEGMGWIGGREGLACIAVAMLIAADGR